MCSILWWILYTWEALGCIFFKFEPWFMHWQQGGERKVEKGCIASLEPIPRAMGELVHFFCIFGFWGVVCCVKSAWPVLETGLTGFGGTCLTGYGNQPDRFVPRVGTCPGGACICAGGALVCFGGLCSLLEHGFVSDVSSRGPCLRGPRFVFFKWSCSLPFSAFDRLLKFLFSCFFYFSFSLWLPNVCVVNALIKGEIEDHVWFEDRWMVASLCDEWLTTLCGLILG
jgi:hypothetical protein